MAIDRATRVAIAQAVASAGGGGVSDGDKGDIVVSGGGTTWTIDPAALSGYALKGSANTFTATQTLSGTGDHLRFYETDAADTSDNALIQLNGNGLNLHGYDNSENVWRLFLDGNVTTGVVTLGNSTGGGYGVGTWNFLNALQVAGVNVSVAGHTHAAADITSGTLATARLGSGTANSTTYLRGDQTWATIAGGGDVTGPASSVDSEIALFSSTTGKVLKRASTTGVLKAASGVISAAVAGTDYARPYVLVASLASDQATGANTTPVTLTGLVFNYEANASYRIWFMGKVSPAAATTGCGFQFDVSSAVTSIDVLFYHQLANTGTLSGGHSIADDASVGVSSGFPGTSTYSVIGDGLIITTSNTGTAQLRFRSETTAVVTCKAGFTLVVERIA